MASFNMLFSTMHEEASSDPENDNREDNKVEAEPVITKVVDSVLEKEMNESTIVDEVEESTETAMAQTEKEKGVHGDTVGIEDEVCQEAPAGDGSVMDVSLKRKNVENDIGEHPNKKTRSSEVVDIEDDNSRTVEPRDEAVKSTDVVGEDARKETTSEKENDEHAKKDNHSALNRRINNALQTTKAKVEEFQAKYGGEADFLLVIRDNMTETNDTGRATRTNRKIVVSGDGSIFEEFMFKEIKFNPKEMIVVKKGKTLQTDYDMLEQWLEKKTQSPNYSGATSGSPLLPSGNSHPLQSSPVQFQHPAMYQPAMYPQGFVHPPPGFVHPYFFHQAGNTPRTPQVYGLEMGPSQETPTFASVPMASSEPTTQPPRRRILSPKPTSEPKTSDSEASDVESDHGVTVKGKHKKTKAVNIAPARRKSNPLTGKDILAQPQQVNSKKSKAKKPVAVNLKTKAVKSLTSKVTNKGNKENEEESTTEEHNLTMAGFEKVTKWLGKQAEQLDDDVLSNKNTSLPGFPKPVTSYPGSSKPHPSRTSPSMPGPSKPKASRPVASRPVASKHVASTPAASKPVVSKPVTSTPTASKTVTSKPVSSKPDLFKPDTFKAVTSKPATSRTSTYKHGPCKPPAPLVALKSNGPSRPTLGTRPGPVSGRTMNMMAESLKLSKPLGKLMTDEEISDFLDGSDDPLRTPTRKRK